MAGEFVDDAPQQKGQFVDSAPQKGQFVDDDGPVQPDLIKTSYGQAMQKASAAAGINPNEEIALHSIEDPTENPKAKSRAGAIGEMQMEPDTFKDYANPGESITNPQDNFDVSARYLAFLNKHYNGDMDKVFAAYNAGQGAVDAGTNNNAKYVKQAEANLEALAVSYEPPKASLSKGKQPPKVADAEPTQAQKSASIVDRLDQASAQAATAEGYLSGKMKEPSGYDKLPDSVKKNIQSMISAADSPAMESSARFVNSLSAIPLDFLNAGMRDLALGKPTHEALIAQKLWEGIKDPAAMGSYLDRLAQQYGPNSADETKFWTQMPGMADALKNAKPTSTEGQGLQVFSLMHADAARFLANHTGIRDLQTFAEYLLNPGNFIPGAILSRGVKGITLGAKGVGAVIDKMPQKFQDHVDNINSTVADRAHAIYTIMPMGDRFHMSYVKGGQQLADEHRQMTVKQAKVPEMVQNAFIQPHVLGNTSLPQRKALIRYHDKFYNANDTAHIRQPQGGDPIYDPLTRTSVLTKGPLTGVTYQEHMNHVFVSHPNRLRLEIPKGFEAETILGPKADKFQKNLTAGRYSEALALHKGIKKPEADAFEQQITARAQPILKAQGAPAARAFMDQQVKLRLVSEHLAESTFDAANVGDQVIFRQKPTGLIRDLSDVNGTTMDERTYYTAALIHMFDEGVKAASPMSAVNFVEGYFPRSGMFKEEPTNAEIMAMHTTAQGQERQGGAGLKPNGPARKFDSIAHAEDTPPDGGGLQENPDFDPAASLQKAMERSLRWQNYVRDLRKYAKPIDYQDAVDNSGAGFTTSTKFAFKTGPDGRKEFDQMVAAEAKARVKNNFTQQQYDALSSPQSAAKLQKFEHDQMVHLYDTVQKAWEARNPNMVWDTAAQTAVDDLHGFTLTKAEADAARDAHPAFQDHQGPVNMQTLLTHEDNPVSQLDNAIESFFHMARSAFLADPTYHVRENLLFIAKAVGRLNPLELAQILFNPKSIPDSELEEAESAGALAPSFGHGVSGSQSRARYAYAGPAVKTDRNLFRRNTTGLPQRIRNTMKAYQNSVDGARNPLQVAQHVLGRAMYQTDKWNQDLTFKVWEDTIAARLYTRARRKGLSKESAAAEARKMMGDTTNLTKMERTIGLQKMEWFYSWFKSQYRLWAKNFAAPGTVGLSGAISGTLQSRNENDPNISNPQQMADRGQTVFYVNGEPYIITLAPPPMRKLGAITSLAATPLTEGIGFMDFGEFTASDLAHSLNPLMKSIFEQMPETFGAKEAQTEMPEDVLKGAVAGAASAFVPPQVSAIQHGLQDHVRFLELLGTPVHKLYDQEGAVVPAVAASKYQKLEDTLLRYATSDAQRRAITEQYNPLIQRLLQQKQEDYGH